jgi:hypothetical protein
MKDDSENANAARSQNTGKIIDTAGNVTEVTYTQAEQDLSWNINEYFVESYTATPGVDGERCRLAGIISGMPDADLIRQNQQYRQAYGKNIYQDLMSIWNDPCGYFGTSNYDRAVEKLRRVTQNVT